MAAPRSHSGKVGRCQRRSVPKHDRGAMAIADRSLTGRFPGWTGILPSSHPFTFDPRGG